MVDIIKINVADALQNNPQALQSVLDQLIDAVNENRDEPTVAIDPNGQIMDTQNNEVISYLHRYLHLRFSDNSDGASFDNDPSTHTQTTLYIGVANTTSTTAPTSAAAYNWTAYTWASGRQVHFQLLGGRNIDISTATANPTGTTQRYISTTGAIDLDTIIRFDSDTVSTNSAGQIQVNRGLVLNS